MGPPPTVNGLEAMEIGGWALIVLLLVLLLVLVVVVEDFNVVGA